MSFVLSGMYVRITNIVETSIENEFVFVRMESFQYYQLFRVQTLIECIVLVLQNTKFELFFPKLLKN